MPDDCSGSFTTEFDFPREVRVTPGADRGEDILDRRVRANCGSSQTRRVAFGRKGRTWIGAATTGLP